MAKELAEAIPGTVEWSEVIRTEIREAHTEWENANRFFQFASGKDQVDYAIHAIIAAEKRYTMLLRMAKQVNMKWPAWGRGLS